MCSDWSARQQKVHLGQVVPSYRIWEKHENGCPRSPGWSSDVDFWTGAPRYDMYEHNNMCQALEVIGQDLSSEVVSLFLEDWELARVAFRCHMALDFLCQEMRDARQDSSESLGSVFTVLAVFGRFSRQVVGGSGNAGMVAGWRLPGESTVTVMRKPFSHLERAVTQRRGVW